MGFEYEWEGIQSYVSLSGVAENDVEIVEAEKCRLIFGGRDRRHGDTGVFE